MVTMVCVGGGLFFFLYKAIVPVDGVCDDRVCDAWSMRIQTYGYLPSHTALPLGLL